MTELKLERTVASYEGMNPDAVASGSNAQILFALRDARKDILTLADALNTRPAAPVEGLERLRHSSEPMACDPDEWTATEAVLAHLLINVIGVPDDVTYTPNEEQDIVEKSIKDYEADNAALTARVKELEKINAKLCDDVVDYELKIAERDVSLKALETQLAAARKAFLSIVKQWPDTSAAKTARAALEVKP